MPTYRRSKSGQVEEISKAEQRRRYMEETQIAPPTTEAPEPESLITEPGPAAVVPGRTRGPHPEQSLDMSGTGTRGFMPGRYIAKEEKAATAQRGTTTTTTTGGTLKPTTETVTAKTVFEGEAPELGELKPYEPPAEWAPERRGRSVQEKAALGIRLARRGLREATAGLGRDPASRLALRRALSEHGINVERTLAGARAASEEEESRELARAGRAAELQYQTYLADRSMKFESAWKEFMAGAQQVTTRSYGYGKTGDTTQSQSWSRYL